MVRDTVDRVHELPNMVTVYTAETTEPEKHPSLQFALECGWYGTTTKDAEPFIEFKCIDGVLQKETSVIGQQIDGNTLTGEPFDVMFGLTDSSRLLINIPDGHPLKVFENVKKIPIKDEKITLRDVIRTCWWKLWGTK